MDKIGEKQLKYLYVYDIKASTDTVKLLLKSLLLLDLFELKEFNVSNSNSPFDEECYNLCQMIALRARKLSTLVFIEGHKGNRELQTLHNQTVASFINSSIVFNKLWTVMHSYEADLFRSIATSG